MNYIPIYTDNTDNTEIDYNKLPYDRGINNIDEIGQDNKNIGDIKNKISEESIIMDTSKKSYTNTVDFGIGNDAIIEKVTFELANKAVFKACADVNSNGFTYDIIKDKHYVDDITEDKEVGNRPLGDLQRAMFHSPIKNIQNYGCFSSIVDIVKRCFIKDDENLFRSREYIYEDPNTGKPIVYYGFVFSGFYGKIPTRRAELLGIQLLKRKDEITNNKKIVTYIGQVENKEVIFHQDLVFYTPYGADNDLYMSLFKLQASLLNSVTERIKTSKFVHVVAPNAYFSLSDSEKDGYTKKFENLANGKNSGIITTGEYNINLHSINNVNSLESSGIELFSNSISFITGIPQSVLFGMQAKGWGNNAEEDRIKYDFFLKTIADTYFIPIIQHFCIIYKLKDYKKLQYKSNALIREKIDIYNSIIPEEIKTPERNHAIGELSDVLLGIDTTNTHNTNKDIKEDKKDIKEDEKDNNSKN